MVLRGKNNPSTYTKIRSDLNDLLFLGSFPDTFQRVKRNNKHKRKNR